MGCCVSKKVAKFPKAGLHLYSKEGMLLYTLSYANNKEYLLINSISHDVVTLSRIDDMRMENEHTVCTGLQAQCNATGVTHNSHPPAFCSLFTRGLSPERKREVGLEFSVSGIVIDGWVDPGWWISACWFFMFDETHKRLLNNNFLVSAHYLWVELSTMSISKRHKNMGIKYLVSIGTYDRDGEFTVFTEVMYGM